MAEIKKSCIEGICSVPTNWKLSRFRYVFTIKKAKLPDILYDENDGTMEPYMTMEYIRDKENVNPQYTKDGTYCNMDDILLLWDGSNAGEIIYKHPTGYAPSTTAILTLLKSIDKNYAKFYLKFLEEKLRENTNGMGIPHVDGEFLKNLLFLIPDKEEQKFISNFLDDRIEKIDDILKDIKKEIEILNKYKKSLITEAVTKGIELNVDMKDSDIKWIGMIPKSWQICRIKDVCSLARGGSPRPIDEYLSYNDKDINWIKIGDTIKGYKYIDSTEQKIIKAGISKSRYVQKGDLILTNSMSFGQPYILNINGCIHDGWLVFSNYKGIDKLFLYYVLMSDICFYQFKKSVAGAVVENLNIDKVASSKILVPPLYIQEKIISYLEDKCNKIDELVEDKQKQIEKMERYKKSLIYEYVTGKKRVKGAEELYG